MWLDVSCVYLQTSDTVIIYDPDPNPKNEEQAIARSHRIGQKKEVRRKAACFASQRHPSQAQAVVGWLYMLARAACFSYCICSFSLSSCICLHVLPASAHVQVRVVYRCVSCTHVCHVHMRVMCRCVSCTRACHVQVRVIHLETVTDPVNTEQVGHTNRRTQLTELWHRHRVLANLAHWHKRTYARVVNVSASQGRMRPRLICAFGAQAAALVRSERVAGMHLSTLRVSWSWCSFSCCLQGSRAAAELSCCH